MEQGAAVFRPVHARAAALHDARPEAGVEWTGSGKEPQPARSELSPSDWCCCGDPGGRSCPLPALANRGSLVQRRTERFTHFGVVQFQQLRPVRTAPVRPEPWAMEMRGELERADDRAQDRFGRWTELLHMVSGFSTVPGARAQKLQSELAEEDKGELAYDQARFDALHCAVTATPTEGAGLCARTLDQSRFAPARGLVAGKQPDSHGRAGPARRR